MHWIAVIPHKHVSTHKTKKEAITEIGILLTNKSPYLSSVVIEQLRRNEGASTAYGVQSEEIAKVLPCNCGSTKKHQL